MRTARVKPGIPTTSAAVRHTPNKSLAVAPVCPAAAVRNASRVRLREQANEAPATTPPSERHQASRRGSNCTVCYLHAPGCNTAMRKTYFLVAAMFLLTLVGNGPRAYARPRALSFDGGPRLTAPPVPTPRAAREGVDLLAHRGMHDEPTINGRPAPKTPENSRAAFRRSVAGGVPFEFDIQAARPEGRGRVGTLLGALRVLVFRNDRALDRALVVTHDDTLRRVAGSNLVVRNSTPSALAGPDLGGGEHVPTLAAVRDLNRGLVGMNAEIKVSGNRITRGLDVIDAVSRITSRKFASLSGRARPDSWRQWAAGAAARSVDAIGAGANRLALLLEVGFGKEFSLTLPSGRTEPHRDRQRPCSDVGA